MNLLIGDRVSFEHFPAYRIVVLHFHDNGIRWCETYSDWDWYGMRRAIRRNSVDEEQMHVELIELAKLERQLQTRSTSQLIDESERQTKYLARGLCWMLLGAGALLFWLLAGVKLIELAGGW